MAYEELITLFRHLDERSRLQRASSDTECDLGTGSYKKTSK